MNKLILRHTYVNGMAFDASNNRNHGVPSAVAQAAVPYAPSFSFASPDSYVNVPNSTSLENLISIRALVTFNLQPRTANWHRYNLMEGHVSFALFVNPDGSLMGTIVDANGSWIGAQSPPKTVSAGVWHQAELRHDGVNECVLLLDGRQVASSYAARGPVRGVGPHGIAIGHWPEASGVYTFEGHLRAAELYKFDPVEAAKSFLDPCCGKGRQALDQTADRLREQGYTASMAREQGMALLNLALGAAADVRGNDAKSSEEHRNLSLQALGAFMRHDDAAYTTAFAQLAALASRKLSPSKMSELREAEKSAIEALPLPIKEWQKLIASTCLEGAKLDVNQLVTDYERLHKKHPPVDKV